MRAVTALLTMLATSAFGVVLLVTQSEGDSKSGNTYHMDIVDARDGALLDQFLASLDPEIMKECVDQFDTGRPIDLDHLATCGDFDAYARYMRLSKFEAVKKFEYVLLNSSSKLEFEDKLAR
ncbi:hypothetical protein [Roseiconus lacunae]|uniref:Uncharacterized protein n=1 Tax=Roseiconus lacunae TaxID=2605694 RepID=A0ABT7PRQ2_9BACT|nr:hypothetical protein [Roseiconus lacunae]MCD0457956.1 hypothetical protein [Roseiconus lacunae]MDM4019185.1 hypothetical protein [Roseiconus lacunae]WRQ48409.1 hypothetical protein U8335_15660 [Stieleria sp. HD01]